MLKPMRVGALVLMCCLGLAQGSAAQAVDFGFHAEVDALVASERLAEAEALVETAFLASGTRPLGDRLELLDTLADLQARSGKDRDRGDTLSNRAALLTRALGADHPDLAPVYAAAGDAYMAAGAADLAAARYRAALRLDEVYLDCASPALGLSHRRLAEALAANGATAESRDAQAMAEDPARRCGGTDGQTASGRTITIPRAGGEGDFTAVELLYGTDRKPSGGLRPNDYFGWERGPLAYGQVIVTVPRVHKPGQIEAPSLRRFQWDENPALHIVLTDLDPLDEAAFFETVAVALTQSDAQEVFLFIHGYNTSFADAAKRTAQIAYDMNYDGVPMFYSWPSRGATRAYLADAATVQVSARHLLGFLEDIVSRSGARKINLIAHSMGSRALTEALELYAARHPAAREVFAQVIFAAPDVDADLFVLQAGAMQRLAQRITLYTSNADVALGTSQALHGDAPRAGGGAAPVVAPAFDTVDMTLLGDDFLQHTYFAADATALADILWLFWRNPSPAARCGMVETDLADGVYWVYRSEACDEGLLLPAITLARRFGDEALARFDTLRADLGADADPSELDALQALLAEILPGAGPGPASAE